ncbi:MAG TPA: DUF92 domain-containing protein, partial [Chloroflexia bacterium]|nr:DUF92 domain-containing protein [Chloroflexia bacterium]
MSNPEMTNLLPWLVLAITLSCLVAAAGYRARALSGTGAITASLVGSVILGLGGFGWAVVLFTFFASSSLLSSFKASDLSKQRAAETFDKGGRRDAAQVMANGGVASLFAIASA